MNKTKLIQHIESLIINKIDNLQFAINENRKALSDNTKSSAGDKHETSRAMAQLEQEKLGKQLQEQQSTLASIRQIETTKTFDSIQFGSLFQLPQGWFFLSAGIGKIDFEGVSIFCLTAGSPLGQQVLNKKVGNSVVLAGKEVEILDVN